MTRLSTRSDSPAFRSVILGAILFAALSVTGCERALQVAPSSSVLVLTAPASTVALNGSITVTATLTTDGGTAVADGTLVYFTSTLGTISPVETRISNGRATATLAAGSTAGLATISASSGGISSNSLSVRVGTVPNRIVMSASTVGTATTVVASVFDVTGLAMPSTQVTFSTTAGTLSTSSVTTDAFGQATVTLFATTDAIVTATATGVSASLAVRFGFSGALGVNLSIAPTAPTRRDNVIFTAAVTAPNNQPVFVQRYEWTFSDGTAVTTTGNQTARAFLLEGNYAVTVRVITIDGAVGISRIEFHVD